MASRANKKRRMPLDLGTEMSLLDESVAFLRKEPAGGSLHIMLSDGNLDDGSVDFCVKYADEHGDDEAKQLAIKWRTLSRTQRKKLWRSL